MATRKPSLLQRTRAFSRGLGLAFSGLVAWDVFQAFRMGDRDFDYEFILARHEQEKKLRAEGIDPLVLDENLDRRLRQIQLASLKRELEQLLLSVNAHREKRGEPLLEVVTAADAMTREQFWRGYLDHAYVLVKVNDESGDLNLRRLNAMNGLLFRFEQIRSDVPNTALENELGFTKEEDRIPEEIHWELQDVVVMDPSTSLRREKMIEMALGFEGAEFGVGNLPIRLNGGNRFVGEPSRLPDLFDEDYSIEDFWPETLRVELLSKNS